MKQGGSQMSVIITLFIAVVLAVSGQIFVKQGLNMLAPIDFASGLLATYARIFFTPYVLVGSFLYFASVFFWIYALTKVELSFAFPFLALSYVLITIAAFLFLGERISPLRWIGVLVICIGIFLVSRS
jgi:drug/metabolite transporter (DMT)-like permease